MTPHSKEEAVRLANAEAAPDCPIRYNVGHIDNHLALRALARYIDANPAISAEDRTRARELVTSIEKEWHPIPAVRDVLRLLRLIAGPEEVDPLEQFYLDRGENPTVARRLARDLRSDADGAGYDIVKRESVS